MKKLSTILAALALGATAFAADEPKTEAPAAPAAPTAPAGEKKHHTPEEAFALLDTDKSGDISLAEFKAGPRGQKDPAKAEELYKKMDADNNGKVTLEEFKAAHHEKKPK